MNNEKKMNNNIYRRIFEAKKFIASQSTKKLGYNKFSGYSYYTPEQIETLVISACEKTGLDFHFSLLQDDKGLYGKTIVVNLDNPQEQVSYELRVEVPEIKATNRTQQYGGAMTYCRRYMLQNIFSIVDNELDFDNEHSPVSPVQSKPDYIDNTQRRELFAVAKESGVTHEEIKQIIARHNLDSTSKITKSNYPSIIAEIRSLKQ